MWLAHLAEVNANVFHICCWEVWLYRDRLYYNSMHGSMTARYSSGDRRIHVHTARTLLNDGRCTAKTYARTRRRRITHNLTRDNTI